MSLVVSKNLKTGRSINLDHGSCRMTALCREVCYGKLVTLQEAEALGVKSNCGPITWPKQQEIYRRNRLWLEQASSRELKEEALRIKSLMAKEGRADIRLCGMGDLTKGLVRLAHCLVDVGVSPWGFSK